ncbi:MAG: amidohydrolase family protein [Christensenellales bacterium]
MRWWSAARIARWTLDALKTCIVLWQDRILPGTEGAGARKKLTMQQALTLCTENLAILEKQQTRGTLSVGKQADFVMVDHDLCRFRPKNC